METSKKEYWMKRSILVLALSVAATAALGAQQASQSSPYQGVSNPPADDAIVTTSIPAAKPPAGKPVQAQVSAQPPAQEQIQVDTQAQPEPQPTSVNPSVNFPAPGAVDGSDEGIVRIAPNPPAQPPLNERAYAPDPDGDIVHPHPLGRGEIGEGTVIRVRLLERLSTAETEKGEPFRTRVASDVLQGGEVLIPAGAEIDGRVVEVSSGHAAGYGTMRLQPETVILADGTRFRLHAETTGTPGSRTHVVGEGTIRPDSRAKRDGIEFGGAVGAGVVTGAIVAGPVGALTGGLIGAGAVTVHLLVSHPQATLESGTTLLFTLTERLNMVPATWSRN
jgi:hypothetical protein